MKLHKYLIALLITLLFIISNYIQQKEIDQLKAAKPQIIETVKVVEVVRADKTLLDKIDELTRQNVRLLQEVADQANQIREFGWLKEEMDKEGVNP
jgi:hypothetical protein